MRNLEGGPHLKIAIINDIHIDDWYNPKVGKENFCRGDNPLEKPGPETAPYAAFTRYGCDPSPRLVDLLLSKVEEYQPDLVLMAGDFNGHGLPIKGKIDPAEEVRRYGYVTDSMSNLFRNFVHP